MLFSAMSIQGLIYVVEVWGASITLTAWSNRENAKKYSYCEMLSRIA